MAASSSNSLFLSPLRWWQVRVSAAAAACATAAFSDEGGSGEKYVGSGVGAGPCTLAVGRPLTDMPRSEEVADWTGGGVVDKTALLQWASPCSAASAVFQRLLFLPSPPPFPFHLFLLLSLSPWWSTDRWGTPQTLQT